MRCGVGVRARHVWARDEQGASGAGRVAGRDAQRDGVDAVLGAGEHGAAVAYRSGKVGEGRLHRGAVELLLGSGSAGVEPQQDVVRQLDRQAAVAGCRCGGVPADLHLHRRRRQAVGTGEARGQLAGAEQPLDAGVVGP